MRGTRKSDRILAAALGVAAFTLPVADATAADWFIGANFSTTGVYDDNLSLQQSPAGDVVGSLNNLTVDIKARNPTSVLEFTNSFDYRDYWGAGATGQFGGLDTRHALNFEKKSKLTDVTLGASLSRQNANSSELTDTGVVSTDVTRLGYDLGGTLVHRINFRNSLHLNADASMVDFTGSATALTPSRTASAAASWHYRGTKRTTSRLTLGAEWFEADNASETENLTWRATAGLQSQLGKTLTFDGQAGAILVESRSINLAAAALKRETDVTLGYVADGSLTWALKRTTFTLGASHSVSPGSLGDLQTRTSLDFSVSHAINDLESVSLSAGYSELTQGVSSGSSSTPARKLLTISPSYSWQLTRRMRANLAYKFVQVDNGVGTATSNSVMLTFSRDFVFLP